MKVHDNIIHLRNSSSPTPLPGLDAPTSFRIETHIVDNKRVPREIGKGAYARVFAVQESLWASTQQIHHTVSRTLAAKVFHGTSPGDAEVVFHNEVNVLQALTPHDRIVEFRGAVEEMPPTFVCGNRECGATFQVVDCPTCGERLSNSAVAGALSCTAAHHVFPSQDMERMTASRPCGHKDECTCINFLFGQWMFFERLEMDLKTLGERLVPTANRGFELMHGGTDRERKHATVLLKVDTLIGVAEGMAHCHTSGKLLTDVAPENVMIRFASRRDGEPPSIANVKLIDLGRSRRIQQDPTSASLHGRIEFSAPEQFGPSRRADVSLQFAGSRPQQGELCMLESSDCSTLELEPGDFAIDSHGAEYRIIDTPDSLPHGLGDGPSFGATLSAHQRCARILRLPAGVTGNYSTLLEYNFVIGIPADVFGFGCLAAWLLAGSNKKTILEDFRTQALMATRCQRSVDAAFIDECLESVRNAVELPDSEYDRTLRVELLQIVFRCLVRVPGAYCARRSTNDSNATGRLISDLKKVRDQLLILHKLQPESPLWQQDPGHGDAHESSVAALRDQALRMRVVELEQERDRLAADMQKLAADSDRFLHETTRSTEQKIAEANNLRTQSDSEIGVERWAKLAAEAEATHLRKERERMIAEREALASRHEAALRRRIVGEVSAALVGVLLLVWLYWPTPPPSTSIHGAPDRSAPLVAQAPPEAAPIKKATPEPASPRPSPERPPEKFPG